MGVFEMASFEKGTKAMMDKIVEVTQSGTTTVIGGGVTATACKKHGTEDKFSHCSTGVGASLELVEDNILPKVAALDSVAFSELFTNIETIAGAIQNGQLTELVPQKWVDADLGTSGASCSAGIGAGLLAKLEMDGEHHAEVHTLLTGEDETHLLGGTLHTIGAM